LVDLETIHMSLVRGPIRNLVHGITEHDRNRVIIDGRTVDEGGEVLEMDERPSLRNSCALVTTS